MRRFWLLAIGMLATTPLAAAGQRPDLVQDVLPLLKTRCVKCHGPSKAEGGLKLSTPGTLKLGGESGELVTPGDAAASLLWQRIEADEMPPEEPLGDDEKAVLQSWIAGGAAGLPATASDHPSGDHWAFVPLTVVALPEVQTKRLPRTDVDRFILAALESRGLTFSAEADRRTLIRRVAFDLTGLPPTPERGRGVPGGHVARCVRADGRPLPGFAALRRAVGQVLARRRAAMPTATATSTPTPTGRWPIAIATTSCDR